MSARITIFLRAIFAPSVRWRLLFALLAGGASWMVTQYFYNNAPLTTDENSYVFQAYCFRDGCIARDVPPMPDIFKHEMIIMDEKVGWLSRYAPGHPLWLLPGAVLGHPRLMVVLAAMLGIWILGAVGNRLDIPPLFVPLSLFMCPFYQLMYGTLLSHTSGFIASALLLWAYVQWRRENSYAHAVFAGLAWGFLFLNRTYTALLIGLPFGVDALVALAYRRDKRTLTGVFLFAGVAASFIPLYMLYNYLAVGDPRTPTFLYYGPTDHLGFGPRRTISEATTVIHTFARGWDNLVTHVTTLNTMLYGMKGSMLVLLVLTLLGWSIRWSPLLCAATLSVWLGYIYFWYAGIEEFDPLYYFETLPFMIVNSALGLKRIWIWLRGRPVVRYLLFAILFITYAFYSTTYLKKLGAWLDRNSHYEGYVLNLIRNAPPQSLVIVENMPEPLMGESIFNPRGLQSDPLVVRSIYNENQVTARCFSNRTAFILRKSRKPKIESFSIPEGPLKINVDVFRTPLLTGENITLPETKQRVRVAREGRNAADWLSFAAYRYIHPGRYSAQARYSSKGISPDRPTRFEIASEYGTYVINGIDIHGDGEDQTASFDFIADKFMQVEPRVYYGGSGNIMLFDMQIDHLPE
ncbi:MAG: hypothetical protein EOM20_14520 [Spartobacteria bacterium]|nr:hypothetical protein [Spartobacteria bacterium]